MVRNGDAELVSDRLPVAAAVCDAVTEGPVDAETEAVPEGLRRAVADAAAEFVAEGEPLPLLVPCMMSEILERGDTDALALTVSPRVARGLPDSTAEPCDDELAMGLSESARVERGLALVDADSDESGDVEPVAEERVDTLAEAERRAARVPVGGTEPDLVR
jgi:hypothetical protein